MCMYYRYIPPGLLQYRSAFVIEKASHHSHALRLMYQAGIKMVVRDAPAEMCGAVSGTPAHCGSVVSGEPRGTGVSRRVRDREGGGA